MTRTPFPAVPIVCMTVPCRGCGEDIPLDTPRLFCPACVAEANVGLDLLTLALAQMADDDLRRDDVA